MANETMLKEMREKREVDRVTARKWVLKALANFDTLSADNIEALFAENAVMRFGGNPEVRGREGIKAFFAQSFPNLISMQHILNNVETIENSIYHQADIIYVVKNDTQLPAEVLARGFAVCAFEEVGGWEEGKQGQMVSFEVFADFSALGERVKGVMEAGGK